MEGKYSQRFNYARIRLFKNYSTLGERSVIYETQNPDRTSLDPFDNFIGGTDSFSEEGEPPISVTLKPKKFTIAGKITQDKCPILHNLNLYRKSPRCYFYTNHPTESFVNHAKPGHPTIECDVVKLINVKSSKPSHDYFETTKDRQIKRNYYNPFASMEIYTIERSYKSKDGKVSIKYFFQTKKRDVCGRFYKKKTHSVTITFDLIKGNFLVVMYDSAKKKKRKQFFSNSFLSLERALADVFKTHHHTVDKKSPLYDEFISIFNDDQFRRKIYMVLGNGFSDPLNTEGDAFYKSWFPKVWMVEFVKLKQIKCPNDYERLLRYYYPTERYLKKNNRKLVAAVLDRLGIKSKSTVKILHRHSNINLGSLMKLCRLLGPNYSKYLGNINSGFFTDAKKNPWEHHDVNIRSLLLERRMGLGHFILSDTEKENIIHIMNDACENEKKSTNHYGLIDQFHDHFVMRDRLRLYFPELSLTVTKWKTFNDEHARYSTLERNIKKGYSLHMIFENHIKDAIEVPIEYVEAIEPPIMYCPTKEDRNWYDKMYGHFSPQYVKHVFIPKLLTTSEEYTEEGSYQHHCVAGYIANGRSIIISLRKGDERVTCEYDIKRKKCLQARAHSNATPSNVFEKAMEMLHDRIRSIPFSIAPRDTRKVPLKINGKPVIPEEISDAPDAVAGALINMDIQPIEVPPRRLNVFDIA